MTITDKNMSTNFSQSKCSAKNSDRELASPFCGLFFVYYCKPLTILFNTEPRNTLPRNTENKTKPNRITRKELKWFQYRKNSGSPWYQNRPWEQKKKTLKMLDISMEFPKQPHTVLNSINNPAVKISNMKAIILLTIFIDLFWGFFMIFPLPFRSLRVIVSVARDLGYNSIFTAFCFKYVYAIKYYRSHRLQYN